MIQQITVFLENKPGRLAALCTTLGDAGINMDALTIAETSDYGLIRIICDNPKRAQEVLQQENYRANITDVVAVSVSNKPGGLAYLLNKLDDLKLNIEYGYCFSFKGETAFNVLKVEDAQAAEAAIVNAGYTVLEQKDL